MAGSAREKAFRAIATEWHPIPAGAFSSEGTNVPTVLMLIQN
jgi:hypothetical protein